MKASPISNRMNADYGFSVQDLCRFLAQGKEQYNVLKLLGSYQNISIQFIVYQTKSRGLIQLPADRERPDPAKIYLPITVRRRKIINGRCSPFLQNRRSLKKMLRFMNRRLFATPTAQAALPRSAYALFEKDGVKNHRRNPTLKTRSIPVSLQSYYFLFAKSATL